MPRPAAIKLAIDGPASLDEVVEDQVVGDSGHLFDKFGIGFGDDRDTPGSIGVNHDIDGHIELAAREGENSDQERHEARRQPDKYCGQSMSASKSRRCRCR